MYGRSDEAVEGASDKPAPYRIEDFLNLLIVVLLGMCLSFLYLYLPV